jgi:hypothetical protein
MPRPNIADPLPTYHSLLDRAVAIPVIVPGGLGRFKISGWCPINSLGGLEEVACGYLIN